jgi:cytochrome c2
MEEDIVGTMRTLGVPTATTYVDCARCGQMVPRERALLALSDAQAGVSEYQYLCASCHAALADGDQELAPNDF